MSRLDEKLLTDITVVNNLFKIANAHNKKAASQSCSIKKLFLKISQNSQ